MKIKSPLGTDLGRARLSQIMVSPAGSTPAGENVSNGTTWKINWHTKSAKFVIFNNQIRALDSQFPSLSPVDQNSWAILLAALDPRQGCGCELQTLTPVKLYRNVNLNRWMKGQASISTAPIWDGRIVPGMVTLINNYAPPFPQDNTDCIPGNLQPGNDWVFLSDLNSALWVYGPAPDSAPWEWITGDAIFEFCHGYTSPARFRWCTSDDQGIPGSTGIIDLLINH